MTKVATKSVSSRTPQKASRGSLRFSSWNSVFGSSRKKLKKAYLNGCSASPSWPCLYSEIQKAGSDRDRVPACVRKQFRISGDSFDDDRICFHGNDMLVRVAKVSSLLA